MRPVFDRLGELGIPPEADIAEAPESDMTLIHELDDLIRNGFETESSLSLVEELGIEADDNSDVATPIPAGMNFDHGQVEALLARLGGAASLDIFLRDFAKSKGFQRLGKNVRKSIETELNMLSRKGKILIKGGMIQLL